MIDNSSIREGECSFCKESCDKMHKEMTLGCESTAMTSLAPGQLLYRPHCQREELMGPLPGTAQETVDALVCCTSPWGRLHSKPQWTMLLHNSRPRSLLLRICCCAWFRILWQEWQCGGVPITSSHVKRKGKASLLHIAVSTKETPIYSANLSRFLVTVSRLNLFVKIRNILLSPYFHDCLCMLSMPLLHFT